MPWSLGPADGRHVLRDGDGAISHVIVVQTLGAGRRGPIARRRRGAEVTGVADPAPVSTGRATVIRADSELGDEAAADAWVRRAGDGELDAALRTLGRLVHAQRLAVADPSPAAVTRARLIAARIGYGDGEALAAGRFTRARELAVAGAGAPRGPRRRGSTGEAHLAGLLSGRRQALACEELVLRARLDLDEDRPREAALQLLVALDAALAELPAQAGGAHAVGAPSGATRPGGTQPGLRARLERLRARRDAVTGAAQTALSGVPSTEQQAVVGEVVAELQAALRARAAGPAG